MGTLHTVVTTLFAVLALTAAVEASDLWTTPVQVAAGEALNCLLFNTGTRDISATITIYSFQQGLVLQSGPFPLGPKQFTLIGTPPLASGDQAACDFTVSSKTKVRATGQTTISHIAVSAQ